MDSSSSNSVFTSPFPFLIIAIATLDLHLTCKASDVDIYCPCPFKEEVLSIKCTINTTAIASKGCSVSPTTVKFDLTTNGVPSILCIASSYPSCTFDSSRECGCTEQKGELNIYTYTFTANSSLLRGGTVTCYACANPLSPLIKTSSPSCNNIEFGTSCNVVAGDELCSRQCQLGLGLGLGLGIPVCIAIGFLVAYFGFHWRPNGCNQRNPGTGPEVNQALKPVQS